MFERTRTKLTAWYLVIIMAISLLFSVVIYSMVNSEFVRFERMQIRIQENIAFGKPPPGPKFVMINPQNIERARKRLIITLGIVNLGILIISGGAGYFLAGRTLKPIKDSMDDQKRFISDSSHELRTPITSLRSEIEVNLMNKNLTLKGARKVLESNLEEVISLQILSDSLLELAQNGKLINKNSMEEVSIANIIEAAIKKTEKVAKAKQITIDKNLKEATIMGFSDRLTEVFVILLDNAIKYSRKNNIIEISSSVSGNNVKISIQDHGIGISDKDLPHIFDRFYRAQKSRTENGYGLGLSIAKKIISSHNGSIEVKSKIDKGTTFIVSLPTHR